MVFQLLVPWPTFRIFLKVFFLVFRRSIIGKRTQRNRENDLSPLGIEIATNGIYISRDMSDNASGGGYVAFVDMDTAYKAADLFDREHLQDRFGRTWIFRGDITSQKGEN